MCLGNGKLEQQIVDLEYRIDGLESALKTLLEDLAKRRVTDHHPWEACFPGVQPPISLEELRKDLDLLALTGQSREKGDESCASGSVKS